MRFHRASDIQKLDHRIETEYLRHVLTALILLALLFVVAGLVVFVTRAQNPSCADLKRRVDDATRAYQTVLTQSQSIDKNYALYQSTVRKLREDLVANDKRKAEAARDIGEAQRDRAMCEDKALWTADVCANVTHRIDSAQNRLAYFRANENKLYADLSEYRQRLATTKATLAAANANLTTAQQDVDEANKAYTAAGCGSENLRR